MRIPGGSPHACSSNDLADGKLKGQPIFALLLLGYVAEQAAHRQWNAGLVAPAQAQLQLEEAAVGRMVTQRSALDHLAIQRAAEEGRCLAACALKKTRPQRN